MSKSFNDYIGLNVDLNLLETALTHKSFAYENNNIPNNEKLEFLGDAILGFIVTDYIYTKFPKLSEDELAKKRSAIVSTQALAKIAYSINVGRYIKLGKGEEITNGRKKASILADTFEAIIGAIYLDKGIKEAKKFILDTIMPLILDTKHLIDSKDWKTSIQQLIAVKKLGLLNYKFETIGPDHSKLYKAYLTIDNKIISSATASSKKEAEKIAAKRAWNILNK